MPASVRIIRIIKELNPMSRREDEKYTVEFEIEAYEAKDLLGEIQNCPYGTNIIDFLDKAEFVPKKSHEQLLKEKKQAVLKQKKHDEEMIEKGRQEVRKKWVAHIRKKRSKDLYPEKIVVQSPINYGDEMYGGYY